MTPRQPRTSGPSAIGQVGMRKRPVIAMNAEFKWIKPAALSRHILALTGDLEVLAQAKKAPGTRASVNHAWNDSGWRRKPQEATYRSPRRILV